MKIQRALVALTVVNLGLMVFLLAQMRPVEAGARRRYCVVGPSRSWMIRGECERASRSCRAATRTLKR